MYTGTGAQPGQPVAVAAPFAPVEHRDLLGSGQPDGVLLGRPGRGTEHGGPLPVAGAEPARPHRGQPVGAGPQHDDRPGQPQRAAQPGDLARVAVRAVGQQGDPRRERRRTVPGEPQVQLRRTGPADPPADVEGQRVAVLVEVDEGERRHGAGVGVGGEVGVGIGGPHVEVSGARSGGQAVGMPCARPRRACGGRSSPALDVLADQQCRCDVDRVEGAQHRVRQPARGLDHRSRPSRPVDAAGARDPTRGRRRGSARRGSASQPRRPAACSTRTAASPTCLEVRAASADGLRLGRTSS